jgi:spore coat protein U-like protein
MKLINLKTAAVASLMLLPGYVLAATSTPAAMVVTTTVLTSCTVAALPLAFGNYSQSTATDTAGTTTVTAICSSGLPYHVRIDKGANGASVTTRQMKGGTTNALLNYGLYRDSNHTLTWGVTDSTDTLDVSSGSNTGLPNAITVYGLIPNGQTSAADAYTDTVNVTVSY